MNKELSILLIIWATIFWIIYLFDSATCIAKAESFEGVRYSIIGGCMVKHKGRWLPLENIRGFE